MINVIPCVNKTGQNDNQDKSVCIFLHFLCPQLQMLMTISS